MKGVLGVLPETSKAMNKVLAFVSLFRHVVDGVVSWTASFKVDGVDIGASHLPSFDASLFEVRASKDGKMKYLASKRPLLVTYSDIRAGKKPGKFFTNVASLESQTEISVKSLDAILAGKAVDVEPAKDEPAVHEMTGNEDIEDSDCPEF